MLDTGDDSVLVVQQGECVVVVLDICKTVVDTGAFEMKTK